MNFKTDNTFIGCLAFLATLAIVFGIYALVAWGVAVMVSYVFDIDFGFWKTVCSLILISLVGGILRGNSKSGE